MLCTPPVPSREGPSCMLTCALHAEIGPRFKGPTELKCFEYPLRKLAPNSTDDTHAQLGWQHFAASDTAPGGFVQSAAGQ